MTVDPTKLVLHDRHEALGARFAPFAGYAMPVRYTSIKDEHHAVRQRCGIFDVSHMGEVRVRGEGAVAAVDSLITNHLGALENGRALYTAMCAPDGGIVDDLIVYRLADDDVLVCVNAANRATDFAWIVEHIADGVQVDDESERWVQLAVQGPSAVSVVSEVCPGAAELRAFAIATLDCAGVRCLVARTGYTGEDGFELYIPADGGPEVFDALMAAGQSHGLAPIGLGARDTLRLEARLMLYGNDISRATNPYEAGLGWIVKLDAGDFVGRDALVAIKEGGVSRRLRGLYLEGRGVLRAGYPVFAGDEQVGLTTSGGVAPTLDDQSIGLAYIEVAHAGAERLEVEIRGRRLPVRLTRSAFYKRPRQADP